MSESRKSILIIGAGEAGRMVAEEIVASPELGQDPLGYLDDDPALQGLEVEGLPVLGICEQLPDLAAELGADEAVIAIPSAEGRVVRRLVLLCQAAGIEYKIVPGIREIIKGRVHISQIRPVDPEDLLGRETVDLQETPVRASLAGRRVLVTGAGGSIGSEISRQVAALEPGHLLLLGRGENSIFDIENEIRDRWPLLSVESLIADVRDRERLLHLAPQLKPDVVYHAAAHKHVPFMERFPAEAFVNNVLGTRNVIDFTLAAGAERLVMLSTDKAVDPRGVMGASKRVGELLLLDAARRHDGTRFISVRFGNVLASRGSVVPLFLDQIRRGGPVLVTDPEVTRFFMTIREASMLVVQAGSLGDSGEIYILNMGESVEILELARMLIRMSGLEPGEDIPIEFTGLRPGEKLHEQLMTDAEAERSEFGDEVMIIRPRLPEDFDLVSVVSGLEDLLHAGRYDELGSGLMDLARSAGEFL